MAFRFTQQETLAAGVERVLREELTLALDSLHAARSVAEGSSKRDEGIHSARKSLKKVRALVRALEPRFGRLAEQENAALRDIGHSLSGARDAVAVTEIIDVLVKRFAGEPGVRSLSAVRRKLRSQAAAVPTNLDASYRAVSEVRNRVSEWPPLPDGFGSLADGLRETYRRGRKALKGAETEATEVAF
ncbi:MAG TPA: CHAD domain-containing protein, partial [Bryobacteraceae bacterium]|nr:CHAD domain-containing protein [Bryobacteraceae bacterium]